MRNALLSERNRCPSSSTVCCFSVLFTITPVCIADSWERTHPACSVSDTLRHAGSARSQEIYDACASTEASSTQIPGLMVEEIEMLFTYFPLLEVGFARRTASINALAFSYSFGSSNRIFPQGA